MAFGRHSGVTEEIQSVIQGHPWETAVGAVSQGWREKNQHIINNQIFKMLSQAQTIQHLRRVQYGRF